MEVETELNNTEEEVQTQPTISSNEEIDSMLADLSDEEILNASPAEIEKFLDARENFSKTTDENQENEGSLESEEDTSDDKTEEAPNLGSVKIDGKEVPLNSMEDVKQLLQAGTKYNSLSSRLKPVQRIARMLEKNGFLSDDHINFAINLLKGNKSAIAKLIRDNNIDMYSDLDLDSTYQGTNYKVTDKELEVKNLLDDLRSEAEYSDTIHAITSMDKASQGKFYNNPELIRNLSEQVKSGDYEVIRKEIDRQKALGYLPATDDFTNYFTVGKQLYFDGKLTSSPNKPEKTKASQAKVQQKRKAAAVPKSKGSLSKTTLSEEDIYNMSDEEIMKLDFNKIMR